MNSCAFSIRVHEFGPVTLFGFELIASQLSTEGAAYRTTCQQVRLGTVKGNFVFGCLLCAGGIRGVRIYCVLACLEQSLSRFCTADSDTRILLKLAAADSIPHMALALMCTYFSSSVQGPIMKITSFPSGLISHRLALSSRFARSSPSCPGCFMS